MPFRGLRENEINTRISFKTVPKTENSEIDRPKPRSKVYQERLKAKKEKEKGKDKPKPQSSI